jgi:microsomal dipeptidase-like Zn-dependent dipeptidase
MMNKWRIFAVAVLVGGMVAAVSRITAGQPSERPAVQPRAGLAAKPAPARAPNQPTPVVGFADLHTHHMGHLIFDGEWITGKPSGPIETALAPCTHGELHGLAGAMGRKGHVQTSQGFSSFRDWPSWDNISHQAIYESWLKKAHDEGLKLVVVSFTTFEPMCRALKLIKFRKDMVDDCRDMRVAQRQLDAVNAFAATHPWYVIVKTAAEARATIAKGNLAVVLGLELSNLFDEDHFGRWRTQLDDWHNKGVRTLNIAHEIDNRFGRAATQDPTFAVLDLIKSHKNLDDQQTLLGQLFRPKGNPDGGLTDNGEALVQAMIDKKMLIDVSHLDTSGVDEVIAITRRNAFYPFFSSHTYLHETMTDEQRRKTKHIDARVVNAIKRSGGMLGLRTGPEEQVMYKPGRVENTCHGSSRSFAQGYAFATMALDVPVAFGTDMNGMIESLGPRFASGEDSCSWAYRHCGGLLKLGRLIGNCDAYKDERTMQQAIQGSAGQNGVHTDFDTKGFARYDHMNDLAFDLAKLGLDADPLRHGAESFLRMWERTEDDHRVALPGVGTFKNGRCGTDASDFACEMSKDERGEWAKTQKKEGSCKTDEECGVGLFCDKGTLTLGRNTCKRRLTDGSACDRAAQCGSNTCNTLRCVTPNSKNMGDACYVEVECRTGKCSAAVGGVVAGKCVCDDNSQCPSNQYCYRGPLGVGTNQCKPKIADYQACTSGEQCSGGSCKVRCFTPDSKSFGGSCEFNDECRQGTCSAALLGAVNGKCVCTEDTHCGTGNYCNTGIAEAG